jgi:TPR repeat protein
VPLTWKFSQNLWELTDEIIEKQKDGQTLYLWGKGLFEGSSKHESDYEWSFRCLKRAAKMWCLDAKKFIINNCETVFGNPKAASIELPWLELAAEYECASAYFFLGKKYHYGIGVEKNIDKSVAYYEKAVKQDEPRACNNLALFYFYGAEGVKQDVTRGLELYHKSAEMGRPIAMYNLGKIYCLGENGIEIDKKKGLKYYEMAAKGENTIVINQLGSTFFYGKNGVEADARKGLEFYEKAAEAGNTDAMNNLGIIYFYGKKGVSADTKKGLELLEKAANAGIIKANAVLSVIYKKGKDVQKNLTKSKEYAQKTNKLIEKYSNKSLVYNQIAWSLYLMHEYKDALIWAQKLIEANTTDTNHLDTIACVYKGLKRYDDALKYYQKALDLGRTEAAQDIEEVKKLIAESKKGKKKSTPKKKDRP